ncbi:MAG: TonB-dependent receptor [Acidobacteria bacterium]|nr:TonB-dependent receptor [Acidobacteriota bacterium]MBI3425305.1 TonB-dependent receptor [Acidobacteriota bacterium]
MKKLASSLILALFCVFTANAQDTSALLTGAVTDPQGAVVANAKVIVSDIRTGVAKTVTTNSAGAYFVPGLQPGEFTVSAEAQGFQKLTKRGLRLEIGQRATVDLQLTVGGTEMTVEVSSAAVLLQAESSALEQGVEQKLVENLPLIDQNVMQLVQITPGVVSGNPSNPAAIGLIGNRSFFDSNFSVNGGRGSTNDVLVDGVANTIGDFNGVGATPPARAVQEFKVVSGALSAEYGRTGGGVVTYATRPGGSRYHGSVFEFHQNSEFNANGWFNNKNRIARVSNRRNHFGADFSGPVDIPKLYNGKNKTFFFFNYEGRRNRDPVGTLLTVPTLAQRNGDFSDTRNRAGALISIYNPWTTRNAPGSTTQFIRDQFAGNKINCAALNPATNKSFCDPVAVAALKFYPEPNRAADDTGGSNNYVAAGTNILDQNYYSIRVDHNFSSKQSVYVRWTRMRRDDEQFNPLGNIAGNGRVVIDKFTHAVINHSYTLSNSLFNNFRYGYVRSHANQVPFGTGFDPTTLGLPRYLKDNAAVLQFPTFNLGANGFSYSALGSRGFNNQPRDTTTVADTVTKVWGKHTLKPGFEFRLIRFHPFQVFDTTGNFSFNASYTQADPNVGSTSSGWGLASFLLGAYAAGANQAIYEYGTPLTIYHRYAAGFVQDDWRVRRNLTLNLGLRWDLETGTGESSDRLTAFDFRAPAPVNTPAVRAALGRDVNGLLRFVDKGEAEWAADKKRFAPRLGAAWQLNNKTVVRAGYALTYLPVSVEVLGSVGFNYTISSDQPDTRIPQNLLSNPFPTGIPAIIGKSRGAASLLGQGITAVEDRIGSSYNQLWNLAVQRQLGKALLAQAAYVGSHGVRLPLNSFNLNQLDPANQTLGNTALAQLVTNPFNGVITDPLSALSRSTVARSALLRPFPQYTTIAYSRPLANLGGSSYHGLQLSLQKRFSQGLSFLGHYTWSKTMDTGGTGSGIAFTDTTNIQNIYNIRDEWSLSTQDVPHRFQFTWHYELPFGYRRQLLSKLPRALDAVIGGWQVSGTYTWQQGTPLALVATNRLGLGNSVQRVSVRAGQDPKLDNGTARDNVRNNLAWFNTAAFFNANDEITACPGAPTGDDRSKCFVFGNASRTLGSVRRDNYVNLDAVMGKTFRISEKVNFEFRGEFFNAFNRVVFATPTTSVNDPQFGRVTNILTPPRRVQLAARITF